MDIAAKSSKSAMGPELQSLRGVFRGLFLVYQEGFGFFKILLGFLRNIFEKIHV